MVSIVKHPVGISIRNTRWMDGRPSASNLPHPAISMFDDVVAIWKGCCGAGHECRKEPVGMAQPSIHSLHPSSPFGECDGLVVFTACPVVLGVRALRALLQIKEIDFCTLHPMTYEAL